MKIAGSKNWNVVNSESTIRKRVVLDEEAKNGLKKSWDRTLHYKLKREQRKDR